MTDHGKDQSYVGLMINKQISPLQQATNIIDHGQIQPYIVLRINTQSYIAITVRTDQVADSVLRTAY